MASSDREDMCIGPRLGKQATSDLSHAWQETRLAAATVAVQRRPPALDSHHVDCRGPRSLNPCLTPTVTHSLRPAREDPES